MTYRLVTLEEAKRELRYTGTSDDAELLDIVNDASQLVMNYLDAAAAVEADPDDVAFIDWTDSNGDPLVDVYGNPLRVGQLYEIDSNGDPVLDSNGDPVVTDEGISIIPGSVRRATLLVIGALDEFRNGDVDPISPAVKALLVRYRPPTVA